jgi:hypothetical protein
MTYHSPRAMVATGPHDDRDRKLATSRWNSTTTGAKLCPWSRSRRDKGKRNPGTGNAGVSQLATRVRGEVAQPYPRYYDYISPATWRSEGDHPPVSSLPSWISLLRRTAAEPLLKRIVLPSLVAMSDFNKSSQRAPGEPGEHFGRHLD